MTIPSPRRSAQIFAVFVLLLACFAAGPVFATADGPDHYRVVGVSVNSVLNMRASPNTGAAVIGSIPANADGIANFGCIGGLTLSE